MFHRTRHVEEERGQNDGWEVRPRRRSRSPLGWMCMLVGLLFLSPAALAMPPNSLSSGLRLSQHSAAGFRAPPPLVETARGSGSHGAGRAVASLSASEVLTEEATPCTLSERGTEFLSIVADRPVNVSTDMAPVDTAVRGAAGAPAQAQDTRFGASPNGMSLAEAEENGVASVATQLIGEPGGIGASSCV